VGDQNNSKRDARYDTRFQESIRQVFQKCTQPNLCNIGIQQAENYLSSRPTGIGPNLNSKETGPPARGSTSVASKSVASLRGWPVAFLCFSQVFVV